jgi:pimeloyl-ACP methyl ester carboxylesterase
LLCNGLGARLELLQPLVDHLLQAHAVIRLDVSGVGESHTPTMPYTFTRLARRLRTLLGQYGGSPPDLFTRGGALAQQFANQNPRRCGRLILAATTVGHQLFPALGARYADQLLAVSA